MRLRRLMGVADQIVASRFSSIDLSNKAGVGLEPIPLHIIDGDIYVGEEIIETVKID
ncbi:hypothetical protein [Vibrio cincinnatiensis]|uniref:hypothetical protein n=1 Tax=Vibrio cincinnatiensis TaxID=675 RepID=UPI001EDD32E4|nr:hypothetical protein [Vibrio cincinnatiensis]